MTFLGSLLAWSLQILLIGACAESCAPLVRRSHPRLRAWFWVGALALSLMSPWLLSRLPEPALAGDGGAFTVTSTAVGRALTNATPAWESSAFALWALVALMRLAHLGLGLHRLACIARDAAPVAASGPTGLRVRESSLIRSPAASFLGRMVLVPDTFHRLPESWKKAALAHESIHLNRGHGFLLVIEEVILSLLWFHPVIFRLVRRVRDSREEMVDAATVASVGNSQDYRDMLIGLAAQMTVPAPAVSGTSALSARIESLITLEEQPMLPTPRLRLLIAGSALLSVAALASATAPIGLSQADTKPLRKVISKVQPAYPISAKEKKIEGVVVIFAVVDKDGVVTSASARPEDNPELAEAAMAAVRQWRYEPGEGSVKMTLTVSFKLDPDRAVTRASGEKAASKAPRQVLSKVSPVYPAALKEKRIQGAVVISVVVNEDGVVTSVSARPEDNPELARAAMDAVRQWRYEPGEGSVKMTHTVSFKLQ